MLRLLMNENDICLYLLPTANRIKCWSSGEKQYLWELSGLYEGDIMLDEQNKASKNGLVGTAYRWPRAIVPYYIREEDFGNWLRL